MRLKGIFVLSIGLMMATSVKAVSYSVNPEQVAQHWDGWGVSLCWWAGQCGKWDDEKIDEILDWLVSPEGLNYSHFRYNIGGGDDPENRNRELHHMGKGKGLRAEMEGFKDFTGDQYHWERDSAQRKILLKIREKRPDAVFEAFSNSCPYYMTYSGCVGGNVDGGKDNLKPEYYEEFAHYLVDVCKHYKEAYGIEFKTLEPFNESATNYWYANGSQEGCHFDYQSQIAFLRILAPILQESGLSTIISASDETSVGHSIEAFRAYQQAGVLSLVGQWNTHTYQGDNRQRARLARLVRESGKPFWMSETGSGGRGLAGNLKMAQRLFDDIRYLRPDAWLDWQYMEEFGDQWSMINGSFQRQFYKKVKNYYVRQQCSRFIKRGYDFLQTDCPQTLAAISPSRDTLTLVLLNEGEETEHNIEFHNFTISQFDNCEVYRSSETENMKHIEPAAEVVKLSNREMVKLSNRGESTTLSVVLPSKSITTLFCTNLLQSQK